MPRAMATRSRYISPSTGEYEVSSGDFREDVTLLPSIVLALRTKKGSCAIAPWLGSKLHEVRHVRVNAKATIDRHVRDALAHLAPQMRSLTVVVSIVSPTRIHVEVGWKNRADDRPAIPYTHVMEL